jgi:hypothetical protein
MELIEIQERLNKLDTHKLIDVVKNYKQYGYNDEIRHYALTLLEKQGVTKSDLQLSGNFENKTFTQAHDLYITFKRNSRIALILYLLAVFIELVIPLLNIELDFINTLRLCTFYGSLIGYLIFLILTFLNQSEFYKLVGVEFRSEGAVVYFLLGMPFYIFMYFYFQGQMKEKLKLVV